MITEITKAQLLAWRLGVGVKMERQPHSDAYVNEIMLIWYSYCPRSKTKLGAMGIAGEIFICVMNGWKVYC
jgi:hypothetical protein